MTNFLTVNLSTQEMTRTAMPERLRNAFLGGRGINAYLLSEHIPAGTDPLGPENILVFSCGLLTGTRAPVSARLHVSALSPLTGLLGSSNVGGHFGAELRAAGIQTLLIKGRSPHPVMLHIQGEDVELRDAAHLWGLDTEDTVDVLETETGEPASLRVAMAGS